MHANTIPSHRKTTCRSPCAWTTSSGANPLLRRNAPTPNPITTIPVTSPFRSGYHLATVATGVTYPIPIPAPPITP